MAGVTGSLVFGGKVAVVSVGTTITPTTGHITFAGYVPTIGQPQSVTGVSGHIYFTGRQATVNGTGGGGGAAPGATRSPLIKPGRMM